MWFLKIVTVLAFLSCTVSGLFVFFATYMNVRGARTLSRQEIVNYIGDGLKLTATTNGLAFLWLLVLIGLYFTFWIPILYGTAFMFTMLLLICGFVNNVVASIAFDRY